MFCCCYQAMQEFAHLCQEKDAKVVLSILPLWPKVYAKLSIVSLDEFVLVPLRGSSNVPVSVLLCLSVFVCWKCYSESFINSHQFWGEVGPVTWNSWLHNPVPRVWTMIWDRALLSWDHHHGTVFLLLYGDRRWCCILSNNNWRSVCSSPHLMCWWTAVTFIAISYCYGVSMIPAPNTKLHTCLLTHIMIVIRMHIQEFFVTYASSTTTLYQHSLDGAISFLWLCRCALCECCILVSILTILSSEIHAVD